MQVEEMSLYVDDGEVRVVLPNGAEISTRPYNPNVINGLAGGLADGATFVGEDGSTVTRYGDYEHWVTPPSVAGYQARRLRSWKESGGRL